MTIRIITGPALVGHLFRDEAEAREKAVPVLVYHYAQATGLDVEAAEAALYEVRRIGRDGTRAKDTRTELRVVGAVVASWATV